MVAPFRIAVVLLSIVVTGHCPAQQIEPVETATYNVAFFLERSHPDDKPVPPQTPLKPDAPIGAAPLPSRSEAQETLTKLVRETIDPLSWTPGHIPPAMITIEGEKMIAMQTSGNQRAIANLLSQLRGDGSEKLQDAFDHTRLPKMKFDKTALAVVVQAIAKETQVPIEVDWVSFMIVPLAADSPATIDLKQATVGRAIRSAFTSAAGLAIPIQIRATPKSVLISFDQTQPMEIVTRVYDLQALPTRSSGINPKQPISRNQALKSLVDRIQLDVLHSKRIREVNGQIIVSAPANVQMELMTFLDHLDAKAIAEADADK
jgi:hypothetical protein